jgi:hypothetical protein
MVQQTLNTDLELRLVIFKLSLIQSWLDFPFGPNPALMPKKDLLRIYQDNLEKDTNGPC